MRGKGDDRHRRIHMGRVYWHQRNPQHQLDTSARAGFNIPHDEKRVQRTTLMLPIIETSKYGAFIPRWQFKCQLNLHSKKISIRLNKRTWLLSFGWKLRSNYERRERCIVLTRQIHRYPRFLGLVRNRLVPPPSLMRWYGFNNWLEQKPRGYTTLLQFPAVLCFNRSLLPV